MARLFPKLTHDPKNRSWNRQDAKDTKSDMHEREGARFAQRVILVSSVFL